MKFEKKTSNPVVEKSIKKTAKMNKIEKHKPENLKKINFPISEELHFKIKSYAIKNKTTIKDLFLNLLEEKEDFKNFKG